ncbi:MAG: GH116 family glycosyl hydrolase [Planctomycetota bacterium]
MKRLPNPSQGDRPSADICCTPASGCCSGEMPRRTFIQMAGLAASATVASRAKAIAGPFDKQDTSGHTVPADKKLSPDWIAGLFAKGHRTWYQGKDLETIGMPIGGVCAGQLYLAGDGTLACWQLSNERHMTGYGAKNYQVGLKPEPGLSQGFALRVETEGKVLARTLDCEGFPGVRFCGEYPIGFVEYEDADFPVAASLEAFSPFIPLSAPDSGLPATVMQFTLKNKTDRPLEVSLAGWLENGVCSVSGKERSGVRINEVAVRDGLTMILGRAESRVPTQEPREPIVLADFEGQDYGEWEVEGKAFGDRPARGRLGGQQPVEGFAGKGLVNTFFGGDKTRGKLTSPEFEIDRPWISFLIGGGNHTGKTCVYLLVGGKPVRTAEGPNRERLDWRNWDVRDLKGKRARIEIVDAESGPWGHINVDQIELGDSPRAALAGPLEKQTDFGTMGLALLDAGKGVEAIASLADGPLLESLFGNLGASNAGGRLRREERPFEEPIQGAVGKRLSLPANGEAQVAFVVVWHFPNREDRGQFYATRFGDAGEVASYVANQFDRLASQTRLWHRTWYDSTLPWWLLDRLFSTTSSLATGTCQWWANGRFWAWEGVGCCQGTCTHVWNYEHTMARLFPELERSAREMQDFNPQAGFVEETGMVRFRGEGWNRWAGDGQAGTVLKAYREHLVSADDAFLQRNWPRIKKTLQFLIDEDQNGDGLIEGSQHNTYDIDFYGPNTMVGSLYLAALRAGEEMAGEVGDRQFAANCREIFESGRRLSAERLFDGEYFFQEVDLKKHPKFQYGHGCLSDQVFGQGWAHQVALGYLYPREQIVSALRSIWKYNWAPDVAPHNSAHLPERWFARPGEAGLFTCTWPKSPHLAEGVRYRDEVWTGIEYQVAGNMAWDGLLTEALAMCRGVHERYHPSKHNPWNEVECGDHYARGMASYGVFLGLCGFEYHGPRAHLGFAPRTTPEDFRAAFTAAEGWGTISQQREGANQRQQIEPKWGSLKVQTLAFELPEGATLKETVVRLDEEQVPAEAKQQGRRVSIELSQPIVVRENQSLTVEMVG